ncbi:hypothetical protein N784_14780 [Pontibacillus litoralis JSM 072002]|uniref:HTH marR-type domain-containing protein n=2 Tax=Pontibacillus TaxID=289201 RepID=A0A0A5G8N1_9BACI|nr:hypothetical protein N784_14780 [Pontibacillus litoralis JSM 072002]
MGQLAKRLEVTKGAVTQLVSRLEKKHLVERTRHPDDSRAIQLTLTEKGREAFQIHEQRHHEFQNKLLEELSPEEIAVFEKCVHTFTNVLKEHNT